VKRAESFTQNDSVPSIVQENVAQNQQAQWLKAIPDNWALTPVDGNKRPYRKNWQKENPLDRGEIFKELSSGRAKGYGIRTGEISGGILAIDADGFAAEELLQKHCGDLPQTVSFTSGKPGRRQLLYQVPQEYWEITKTIKLRTGIKGEDGKEQLLEFRWNGCQSVLPPSVHPETGRYHWIDSPQDTAVAECPMWLLELMLNNNQAAYSPPSPSLQLEHTITAKPSLEIFLGRDDRALVESGTGDGGRNNAAQKLSINLIATSRRLAQLGIDYDGDPRTLYESFCSRCNPPLSPKEAEGWWKGADKPAMRPSLDDEKLHGCYNAWLKKQKYNTSSKTNLSRKLNVSVDNGLLSTGALTIENDNESTIQLIVNTVNGILGSNLEEFFERHELDILYGQYKEKITRKLFDAIVASERVKASEVLPEDELRLKSLVDYSQTRINWDEVLPAPLARDIKHDADVLNIDPVMIWQSLLSAVSSLGGQFKLDEYGGIPAVNWTCSVLPSGGGKTRADNLVLSPLRKMQLAADEEFKEKVKEYKQELREYEKNLKDGEEVEEFTEPTLRKHLFEVATIQSILKRLSEQNGLGSLWARDEIKGLFSSLSQFSGGETEAMELLLNLWDNKPTFIDRVDVENSYSIANTALSITGGIQDSVFRKAFKDATDGNGLQARFLFAVPQMRKKRYCKGYCKLSDVLPHLYNWLNSANSIATTIKLAPDAQKYFANLVNTIGDQIEQISHPGIRTWMNKVDTHILRIALSLHLIECYYKQPKDIKSLTLDTLKRAVAFAQYYRSAFHILQEKVSPSDDIASILLQIRDEALRKHPDGISARDVYRNSRPIQNRSKSAGREPSAYVVDLFEKMQQLGYGEVVRKGRTVRFVAIKNQAEENPDKGVDSADNDLNSESNLDENEKINVNTPRCQKPIVNADNQNYTDTRIQPECENKHEFPEPQVKVDNAASEVPEPIGSAEKYRFKEGQTVYPIAGKYQGRECRISAIANGEIWVRLITTQKGLPPATYQRSELSLTAPVKAQTKEEYETYQQASIWDSEEYLEPIDD